MKRLKPCSFEGALRGAEAPLFHGVARVGAAPCKIKIKVKIKSKIKIKVKIKIKSSGRGRPLYTGVPRLFWPWFRNRLFRLP